MDNNTELIEKYLQGQLSPEEENAFKQRILEDDDLRQMLEDAEGQIDEINDQGIFDDEGSNSLSGGLPMLWKVLIGVALLIIVAFFVFKNHNTQKVVTQAEEEAMTEQMRMDRGMSAGHEAVIDLDRMYQKVDAGEDLPATIDSLKIALNNTQANVHDNIETKWYLAQAYVKQSDYANAVPLLKEVMSSGDSKFYGEAQLLLYKIQNKV